MKRYFKGYYFKCSLEDETIAFITAMHRSDNNGQNKSGASLQVITRENVYYIPYDAITFGRGGLKIKLGNCIFSEKGIKLSIDTNECKVYGKLKFGKLQKLKYNIMGPFAYLPFMQCRHRVISMRHSIRGEIFINGKRYGDLNGVGYIEGDRGCSFPSEYLWTQCHFKNDSVMLSVAGIPFCGINFKGIIGVVMIDEKEYRIATYLGAKLSFTGKSIVTVRQGRYTLTVKLLEENVQKLKAPVMGEMIRTIQESICCRASYCFMKGDETLLEFTSEYASFEYMFK